MGALVDRVAAEFAEYEKCRRLRKRARTAAEEKRHKSLLSSIICNVVHAALLGSVGVRVNRGKSRKAKGRLRYGPDSLGKTAAHVLDILAEGGLGYLDQTKGDPKKRLTTVIRASGKLISLIETQNLRLEDIGRKQVGEPIWLRTGKEDYRDKSACMEYADCPKTILYREEMGVINEALDKANIESLEEKDGRGQKIDLARRYLRRIFTYGSFSKGGRLYNGFWQEMDKSDRLRLLRISGEVLVELDYGQAFLSILYGLITKKMAKKGELLELPPLTSDMYDVEGLGKRYREQVKVVTNAMLFAQARLNKMPKESRGDLPRSICVGFIQNAVEAKHPHLKPYFYKGLGHELMFIESQIMVKVMLSLIEEGICPLPIHDAVLVPRSA